MMPAHFGLSDAAIVLVSLWAVRALMRQGQLLAGFAMAGFGLAAAIGCVRFASGLQAELAALHGGGSQVLGLAAVLALAAASLMHAGGRAGLTLAAACLALAAAVFLLAPALIAPLFILALLVALGAGLRRAMRAKSGWLVPAGLGLLLANALVIRRAPWLSETAAWHSYHLLIALALALLAAGLLRDQTRSVQPSA